MALTCRHIRQLFDGYLDGELSSGLNAEVHAHLLQCSECQHEVETVRACGDVIAQDRSEPVLDTGFASRILAVVAPSASKSTAGGASNRELVVIGGGAAETRRGRRRRLVRSFAASSLPVAAAVAFFCGVIWPSSQTASRNRRVVAPAVVEFGVSGVVDPVVNTLRELRETFDRANEILTRGASEEIARGLETTGQPNVADEPSFLDIFLPSMRDVVDPAALGGRRIKNNDKDVIRF